MRWNSLFAAAIVLVAASVSYAQRGDSVKLKTGDGKATFVEGTISAMTPAKVTVQGAITKDVPTNEIEYIDFGGDSPQIKQIRRLAYSPPRYHELAGQLEKYSVKETRPESIADYEFFKALSAAKLALEGTGNPAEAGKEMNAWLTKHPKNWHYYEACELVGDLLVAMNNAAAAETFYAKVAEAPFREYKLKAHLARARAMLLSNPPKHGDALGFDVVIAEAGKIQGADEQATLATLGKAECLAATGKPAEGFKMVKELLPDLDGALAARAYNAMGGCYQAVGTDEAKKDALLCYLRVDVMYKEHAEPHAEALYHLTRLFRVVNKADQVKNAAGKLKTQYPGSRWARLPAG